MTLPPPLITMIHMMTVEEQRGNGSERGWFIIATKPKQEFNLKKNLDKMQVRNYLPLYLKEKKKNKTKVKVVAPLFTGYLFARFPIREMYHRIRYTRGVKEVLGNQRYLFSISPEKIDSIRAREENGVVILKKKPAIFRKGDRVLIDEGDFDGWEGIFYQEMSDRERAVIMLTNVNYSNKLIVPKKFLVSS